MGKRRCKCAAAHLQRIIFEVLAVVSGYPGAAAFLWA